MRVLVIGAGTGGLCLAHGLRRAGIDVTVFERDRTPTSLLLGYRVGISPDGSRALHACLPPEVFDEFVRTCARPIKRTNFRTEKLKTLLSFEFDPGSDPVDSEKSVSRISLRQVLLSGLDDVVQFGKTFTHYSRNADGTVTAHFEDGTSATGDVLVGADGANSRVRKQYLPHAQVVDAGITAIAGKLPLTPETAALLPPNAREAITMMFAPRGASLLIHVMEFDGAGLEDDYIMWGFSASHDKFPELHGDLRKVVLDLTEGWHPDLRSLVRQADPRTVFPIRIRTSEPLPAWESTNVTVLGDAIHTMTPGRGIGANTALRDALLLCRKLIQGGVPAIAEYERKMVEYGFEAVLASRKQINGDDPMHKPVIGRIMLAMFRTMLRTTNAIPFLRRKFIAAELALRGKTRTVEPLPIPARP